MRSALGFLIIVIVALALITLAAASFTVQQTEQALLLRFGEPVAGRGLVTEPGLHFKLPFVENVVSIDKRILALESPKEEVLASDNTRIEVDAVLRYRIVDPLKFYQSVPYASQDTAEGLLTPILSSNIRRVLGSQNFATVLSEKRDRLMQDIRDNMNQEARDFGIVVVDVRIRRADLPQANSDAIYQRMQKERQREANEYRAEGDETAQRVRARAEREVTVLLAEATRESDILRGQGDAEKTRILGEAFAQDPDFFAFYRSMQAYQQALKGDNTTLILSPNSEFFRYFGSGGAGEGKRK